jgi:hypothetical protein
MRFLVLLSILVAGCSRQPAAHGPLAHEVYVWQRHWTSAVREGIDRAAPAVAGFDVLIGEIGADRVAVAEVDYAALARTGKPVSLGLRMAAYAGEFSARARPFRQAVEMLQSALSRAREAGLPIAQLQLDFDCPSKHLAGYANWVRELRATFSPVPLAITALPDWLGQRDFRDLARAAGDFVLQVHSVPGRPAAKPVLCDPAAARSSVERASHLGVPFRVALPTYSCVLLTDENGRVVGIHAEESPSSPTAGQIILRSDAVEMAALVQEWEKHRPPNLHGVIWYRLPIDSNRLNWRWPTLAAILAGKTPQPVGAMHLVPSGDQIEDIVLENRGDADWPIPTDIALPADTAAADGVNGFQLETTPGHPWILHGKEGRMLAPGARLVCGWLRQGNQAALANQTP